MVVSPAHRECQALAETMVGGGKRPRIRAYSPFSLCSAVLCFTTARAMGRVQWAECNGQSAMGRVQWAECNELKGAYMRRRWPVLAATIPLLFGWVLVAAYPAAASTGIQGRAA